jgi:large subunit ribosomal protein L28
MAQTLVDLGGRFGLCRVSDGHLVVFSADMASVCDICGKTPGFGNNISHSHRRSRRRWNPNIQRIRIVVDGVPKRANVCTKCLKANKVRRAG